MNDFDDFGGCLADEDYYKEQQFYKKQENKKKMPKLTDEQILQALECCNSPASGKCLNKCPYYDYSTNCSRKMISDAIDLINRLKADNERLKELCEGWKKEAYKVADEKDKLYCEAVKRVKIAKTEAYKEFAERLRQFNQSVTSEKWNREVYPNSWTEAYEQFDEDIDNILKEMVGEVYG